MDRGGAGVRVRKRERNPKERDIYITSAAGDGRLNEGEARRGG